MTDPSDSAPERAVDIDAFTQWLDEQGLGSGPLEDIKFISGGTQNILMRFTRSGKTHILRRPPQHLRENSNRTMVREATVLKALAGSGVPHPALVAYSADTQPLGYAFYIMEVIDGFNPTTGLPAAHAASPPMRHRMGLALTEGIARLGELDYLAMGLADFGKPDDYLARQVERWNAQLDSYSQLPQWDGRKDLPEVEAIGQWLETHRPASFRPGIMHGDYHLANVMFCNDSAELAAIVDWELATIGDPLIDLGWLLATWPDDQAPNPWAPPVSPWEGFPSAAELIEHYGRHSTRDLGAMDWYRVLACFKLAILLEGTYARACQGKAPKDTGDELHARATRLLRRASHWIEHG
ncbi:MAG: phosphotransferase family protein [Parahaliea sp.]